MFYFIAEYMPIYKRKMHTAHAQYVYFNSMNNDYNNNNRSFICKNKYSKYIFKTDNLQVGINKIEFIRVR